MKRNIKNMAFALLTLFAVTSCDLLEIDNYDGPNATIEGKILDIETGELVEQDIIDGAQIEFIEHGFENPETQYMVIKNNGTYRNNVMFAGSYTMSLMRGNFVSVKDQEVVVKVIRYMTSECSLTSVLKMLPFKKMVARLWLSSV